MKRLNNRIILRYEKCLEIFGNATFNEKVSHVMGNLLSTIYPVRENRNSKFTKRQIKLLQLVDKGLNNQEIATHLDTKQGSVKVNLSRLYRDIVRACIAFREPHKIYGDSEYIFRTPLE